MRELRLVLLGLAAVLTLLLSGWFLVRAFKGPAAAPPEAVSEAPTTQQAAAPTPVPSQSGARVVLSPAAQKAARSAVERAIADAPDYTRFFDRLRLVFPGDYETIMDGLATANAQKKDINADVVMSDAVAALRRAHGGLAARATDNALAEIFTVQLKELQELEQRDPHLCVAFLYGSNGIGFLAFAADHRALVADAAIAGLNAMNSGQMDRVQRESPSDKDFQSLDRALVEKGLSRPEIEALLDGKTADPPIADERMCNAGKTYLQTLGTLPEDMRGRLYGLAVDLMAKS